MTAPVFSITEIELFERPVRLRLPFRFGVITLTACPQAFARVRITTPAGASAVGMAAEMMVPKWFDKRPQVSHEDNVEHLRDVLRLARAAYLSDARPGTAFGHFARHYEAHQHAAAARDYNGLLANFGPALIDRAVLDAQCRLLGLSFYQAMQANLPGIGPGLPAFADLDIARFLAQRQPAATIQARHTVGLVDALTAADLSHSVADGLPETLEQVIDRHGHRFFKLKLGGDLEADLDRLKAIAAVIDRIRSPYQLSLDGNEQFQNAEQLDTLLARMREAPALARLMRSILFIEQPIHRGEALQADFRGHRLGVPVIIDESDATLDTFVQARERGYAGISSKTCKGLYKSVLNAARCEAWNQAEAQGPGFFMSAEDLTTQAGLAVQQDLALVNLLGITHVERNGHHYVNGMADLPEAEQQAFLSAHPDLYERSHGAVRLVITGGAIDLGSLACPGFASAAWPDPAALLPLRAPPGADPPGAGGAPAH